MQNCNVYHQRIFASILNKRLCSNERAKMRRDAQKFHTVSHAMCPLDLYTITKVEKVYGNSIASCLKNNYKYMWKLKRKRIFRIAAKVYIWKRKKNSVVLTAEKRSKQTIPWTKLCCKILSNPLDECISYENCEQPSIRKKFVIIWIRIRNMNKN